MHKPKAICFPLFQVGGIKKALEWPQELCKFVRHLRAVYSVVNGGIWQKFKPIQAFMHVLITCKNEEDSIKNKGARVATCVITWHPIYLL